MKYLYVYEINYSDIVEYVESPEEITKEKENEIWDRLYKEIVELHPTLKDCIPEQYRICEDDHSDRFLLTFYFELELEECDDPEDAFAKEYPELIDAMTNYFMY